MLRSSGAGLLCAALLASCAGEPASGPGTADPSGTPAGAGSGTAGAAAPATTAAPGLSASAEPGTVPSMSTTAPIFHAAVRPAVAAPGEPVTVEITVENPGSEVLHVPDPRPGGTFLVLDLTLPSGQKQSITVGPPLQGGVRPRLVNIRVLPRQKAVIDFDLAERAPISAPGVYKMTLAYTWKPGEVYRSPELTFTIKAP